MQKKTFIYTSFHAITICLLIVSLLISMNMQNKLSSFEESNHAILSELDAIKQNLALIGVASGKCGFTTLSKFSRHL